MAAPNATYTQHQRSSIMGASLSYWLETDTFADDEVWVKLADDRYGSPLYDTLKAAYCDLKAKAAHARRDGYLTASTALRYCRGKQRILDKLCTSVLGEPPLVHRQGDECKCLGDDWVDGYEFRIHEFLKKNPSRVENERNKAQKADLTDARLKALVYERDAGCCRYCRSGLLSPKTNKRTKDRRKILHFDHVDPDKPAGPDGEGFVVACARCNEEKGHRLPYEADMVLLAPPTAAERAEWAGRGQALFDRSGWGPEHADIIGASSVASSPDHRDTDDATDDAHDDRAHDPDDDSRGDVRPESAGQTSHHHLNQAGKGLGSGRVGEPHDSHPDRASPTPPRKPLHAQPVRSSTDRDIYHHRSRAPSPEPVAPVVVYEGLTRYVLPPPPEEETPWT